MATSVSQGLSDDAAGGVSNRIARRVTLADSASVRARLGPAGDGRILDISESGLAAQANMPIQPGSKITIDFDIPDGGHVRTEAQVVWRTADKRMGLRFLRMSEPTRLRLRAWIEALAGPEPAPEPAPAATKPETSRNHNEFWHLISDIKASKLYLDSALALIVERAAELTGATGAALAFGPSENMICRATLGDAPDVGTVINPDSKLTRECISTRHTVHVLDTDADPRVDPFVCRDLNMRSAVLAPAFPNKSDKNFTVVLEMFSSRARNFTPEHISKLEQLAEVAGVLALGDSPEADALKSEAMSSSHKPVGKSEDSQLFAQDELDHLVDRFITDLKIGSSGPSSSSPEPKAPAYDRRSSDSKKPPAFEMSFVSNKNETVSAPTKPEKAAPKPFEGKSAQSTEIAAPAKKVEERKKIASEELEVVSLAEPVVPTFTPKRPSLDRSDLTLGQQAEPPASKVPMIAGAALLVLALIGGGLYLRRHSNTSPKPVVQAETAPAPVAAPEADPNTTLTVTAPALSSKTESSKSTVSSEPAKKASEAKPADKESKQSKESVKEQPKEEAAAQPIVLASAKHAPAGEAPAPMAAPAIPVIGGAAPPPTTIPVTISTPELAATARSTGVTAGVLIHRVSPKYPSAARSYSVSGEVVLKGRITKEGNVEGLKALSGNPLLSAAAIEAVKQWKYKPYQVDGKPIEMETTFRIDFALPR
ncbi:MAG TPA: TonB family protein [Terriglobales bacterium]|nr:TonB family protein [Terriglobales bacterium]